MSIYIHPMVNFVSENATLDTQQSFKVDSPASEATRYLENKPAMLVVTDVNNTILLACVGSTAWHSSPMDSDGYRLQHSYYRSSHSGEATLTSKHKTFDTTRPLCPLIPALRFTPLEQFTTDIVNSGTASKAFLLVDTLATRSATDISTWEGALHDGTVPLDTAALPSNVKYIQLGLGDLTTDQPVRLTSAEIDVEQSVVQIADGYVQLYFTNLYHDWSGMREALDARLAALTGVGVSPQDIADKEAASA